MYLLGEPVCHFMFQKVFKPRLWAVRISCSAAAGTERDRKGCCCHGLQGREEGQRLVCTFSLLPQPQDWLQSRTDLPNCPFMFSVFADLIWAHSIGDIIVFKTRSAALPSQHWLMQWQCRSPHHSWEQSQASPAAWNGSSCITTLSGDHPFYSLL